MGARRLTDEEITRISEMREAGASYAAIGREIGCSGSAVSWHCLRLGIEAPGAPRFKPPLLVPIEFKRGGRPVRRFTFEEDRRILELSLAGKSYYQIAREIGRRHNSVLGRLLTLGRHDAHAEAA